MQLGALHIQDPHESAFSCFSGMHHSILTHQVYWITMQISALQTQDPHERELIFLVLVASQHSHTPCLLDY